VVEGYQQVKEAGRWWWHRFVIWHVIAAAHAVRVEIQNQNATPSACPNFISVYVTRQTGRERRQAGAVAAVEV